MAVSGCVGGSGCVLLDCFNMCTTEGSARAYLLLFLFTWRLAVRGIYRHRRILSSLSMIC